MDFTKKLIALLVLGLVFYLIERVLGNRRRASLLRPGMATDAIYFFVVGLVKVFTKALLVIPAILLVWLQFSTPEELRAGAYHGYGPSLRQPVWLQTIEIYVLVDFSGYWIHRLFHTGA